MTNYQKPFSVLSPFPVLGIVVGFGILAISGCQPAADKGGGADTAASVAATGPSPAASMLGAPPGGAEASRKMMEMSKQSGKTKP